MYYFNIFFVQINAALVSKWNPKLLYTDNPPPPQKLTVFQITLQYLYHSIPSTLDNKWTYTSNFSQFQNTILSTIEK